MNKCIKSPATTKYPYILGQCLWLLSFEMEWNDLVYDFFVCVTTAKWLFPCQLIEVEKNGRQYVMIGSDNGSVPWWSTIIWNNDNLAYWCTHGWLGVKRERGSPWDPNWPADSILKRYSEPCTTLTNGNHEVARQHRFPQRVWYIKWQYIYPPIGENWYQLDLD